MSNPSIRGKSVVLPVARNDPLPVILVNLLPSDGLPSPLRACYRGVDSSRVITDGRVTGIKVQRTTTTPGNPKVGDATSRIPRVRG